jgi:hypothetical protein
MVHCHIAEHLHAGMMFHFTVHESDAGDTGDTGARSGSDAGHSGAWDKDAPGHQEDGAEGDRSAREPR